MRQPDFYLQEFEDFLAAYPIPRSPENLYRPIAYIMGLGGKRIRPVLALMASEFNGPGYQAAMPAALAIEIFHNFSLVHDDIMDQAPLRRGKDTVHERWDINTAILSGDAMLITSYQLLEAYQGDTFKSLSQIFSRTALAVCEGQQLDMDFEDRKDVTLAEYVEMITKKTAILLGASMEMGAVAAGAGKSLQQQCFAIGRDLGIAFQIQDDYLDAFGDPKIFGKQIGGDIIENKKTYLFLKTLENARPDQVEALTSLYSDPLMDPQVKVEKVKSLYRSQGIAEITALAIKDYTERAFAILEETPLSGKSKTMVKNFALGLMGRNS